ncbi:MAG: clostripain-related cysteine peptidase [Candidatus Thermoplasmatota archaeon]
MNKLNYIIPIFLLFALIFILQSIKAEKEWTVMVYMDEKDGGDNIKGDLSGLQSVGSTNEVNFVVLMDEYGYGNTKAYYVGKGDSGLKEIQLKDINPSFRDELNMGDANVPKSFILYTIGNYPAKHYAMIFSGHGNGAGFCYDGDTGDRISTGELSIIFSPAISRIDKKLDIVLVFACLPGNIEFFYEISAYADYAGASQSYSYPFSMSSMANVFKSGYNNNPRKIATDAAESYRIWGWRAYSLIDSSKMEELMDPIDAYSLALINYDKEELVELRDKADGMSPDHPRFNHFREMYQFVKYTEEKELLKETARNVLSVIKNPIIGDIGSLSHHGFGIYIPKGEHHPFYENNFQEYKSLRFSKRTHWDEFIEAFMKGETYLELGVPIDALITMNQTTGKAQKNYYIKEQEYKGKDPFVLLVKTKKEEDIDKFEIKLIMNSKGFFGGSETFEQKQKGIVFIPADKVKGKKDFKIVIVVKGAPSEKIIYSIAAYAEFEKIDENNMEQIVWCANSARVEGNFGKTNDEKYYYTNIPANTKIKVMLKFTGTDYDEQKNIDFDLYVGLAPPQGTGAPRIYKFDYRGFTIDANETIQNSIGGFNDETKVYILVRSYEGSGRYILILERAF